MRILFTESLLSEDTDIVKLIQFDALLYPSDFVNIFVSAFVDHQQEELIKKEKPSNISGGGNQAKTNSTRQFGHSLQFSGTESTTTLEDKMILHWLSVFPPHP